MDGMNISDKIDGLVVEVLNKSEKPLTVYKIAKEARLSWATVNIHCYKLKSRGVLVDNAEDLVTGQRKIFWCLSAKTPTLDKFVGK